MTVLVALPPLTAAPARGPFLAAEGEAVVQLVGGLRDEAILAVELGGRAYGALLPAVPPAVARLLAAGDRRGAAESLAHADSRGEVAEAAVTEALAHVAPHLTAEQRALAYGEDLRPWLYELSYEGDTGAPRACVGDADPAAQVDRCLTELTNPAHAPGGAHR